MDRVVTLPCWCVSQSAKVVGESGYSDHSGSVRMIARSLESSRLRKMVVVLYTHGAKKTSLLVNPLSMAGLPSAMMPLKPSVSACAAMALEYSMPVFISTSVS